MKLLRNPELKKELLFFGALRLAAAVAVGIRLGWRVMPAALALCLALTGIQLYFHRRRYESISALAGEVQHYLHSVRAPAIDIQEEGELSVLQSEINKLFMKLSLQSEQLERDKQFLMDSIADISHQIRTPLTSLTLISFRLREPDLEPHARTQLIRELNILLRHIDWLIQSLLKMAKLDAGAIRMKQETVSVRDLADKISGELGISMDIHSQTFLADVGDETFTGDFLWSCEALANLVKNCTEHTPDGGTIAVRAEENNLYTRIDVTDDGPGFSKEDLPHLFERFYKGAAAGNQSAGIGLALAKMIIQQQNGILTAENRPEGGARFTVTFYKTTV